MNADQPAEDPLDTQAVFPLPPCEVREALTDGIAEAVRRAHGAYGEPGSYRNERIKEFTARLIVELFGDLNADHVQAKRTDNRFLDLQDVFARAITLDNIAKRLNDSRLKGEPENVTLRIESIPGNPDESTFLLNIFFDKETPAEAEPELAHAN